MKIFYLKNKKAPKVLITVSISVLIASIVFICLLPDLTGFGILFIFYALLLGFIGILTLKLRSRPYCLEFNDTQVTPYKGSPMLYSDIQSIAFTAVLTKETTGQRMPNPAIYAALPPLPHLSGSISIITLTRSYNFNSLCDICEAYETIKRVVPDCTLTLAVSDGAQPPALYIYDRYKNFI